MEGLINFVTGIKAACELALSDTEDGTAAEVRRKMRASFDDALGGLKAELDKV